MKKGYKIATITFAILCLCGCGKKEQLNNTNEEIKEPSQIESNVSLNDFQIQLISSNIENGTSEFTFEVTNTSQETKYISELQAIAIGQDENNLAVLFGVIEKDILSGEKETVICAYGGDLSNAKSFTYELK